LHHDARCIGVGDQAEFLTQPDHEIAALYVIECQTVELDNKLSCVTRYAREHARHFPLSAEVDEPALHLGHKLLGYIRDVGRAG
jgi:hypothetical protein